MPAAGSPPRCVDVLDRGIEGAPNRATQKSAVNPTLFEPRALASGRCRSRSFFFELKADPALIRKNCAFTRSKHFAQINAAHPPPQRRISDSPPQQVHDRGVSAKEIATLASTARAYASIHAATKHDRIRDGRLSVFRAIVGGRKRKTLAIRDCCPP